MNFQQFLNILWSRKRLALLGFLLTVATTTVVSLLMPKEYIATTTLILDYRGIDPVTGLSLPSQLLPGYMATQVDIISSHNVALKVVNRLKLSETPQLRAKFEKAKATGDIKDWVADILLKTLEVEPSRESSVLHLSFSAVDPQFSAVVANAFADAYVQTVIDLRTQPAKQHAQWFDEQMLLFREQLEEAQEKLSLYQQKHGIVVVDERLDLENTRLAELSHQLAVSQERTYELLSRKNQFEKNLATGQSYESLEEVLNSPLIQSLKTDLARAEAKFADLSMRVDKNHPLYKRTQAEVNSLRNKIRFEVNNVSKGIESKSSASRKRDQSLVEALAEQKAKVLELKQQRGEVAVLNREVENAQRAYDVAMQRSVQTRMQSEISQTDIAVLNPAIPPVKPAKPRVLLNILLSFFLGGLLGIGMTLVAEFSDRRIHSPSDVAEFLEIPVLGVLTVPRERGKWHRLLSN